MKISLFVFLASLATVVILRSQNADIENSRELTAEPAPSTTPARILGSIPDGTPPPPAPPKPKFRIASQDILDTVTHEQGGRTITIRQIKPIALPPPPPPVEQSAEVSAEFSQRLAESSKKIPKSDLLFLSATVFRSKDLPPRSRVRYWSQNGREEITFWSSADFTLIGGGIHAFEDSASARHRLIIGMSHLDIDHMAELQTAKGRKYNAPVIPTLPEGKATFQIVGKQPAAEDLVRIQALHDLYNSEFARLKTAYEGREAARIERDAYLKANPPQPKDITLNYWRVEQPASKEKEGTAR